MNARCAPGWVLRHHPNDQIADFLGNPFAANDPTSSGNCPPIEREARSVPSYDRLRTHDKERLFPSRPEASRQNPEEFIERRQSRPGMFPLQRRELLAKGEIFQQQIPSQGPRTATSSPMMAGPTRKSASPTAMAAAMARGIPPTARAAAARNRCR